ncbi:MAG: hypothetical protein MZV65_29795 [Chromatiales bacterium]|nr:hypothetical protein [Chromatiales bacterium]
MVTLLQVQSDHDRNEATAPPVDPGPVAKPGEPDSDSTLQSWGDWRPMATKQKPKNAFYAQSGGVTAVINASACGVIETARKHKDEIGKVYAGRNGIIGALTEDLIDTSQGVAPPPSRALRHTPVGRLRLLPLQAEEPGGRTGASTSA